jgi:tetratricopeptide (TPR) repeat protein
VVRGIGLSLPLPSLSLLARFSLLLLLLGLGASIGRAGDPDVADFLLKKAQKALRAKDYAEAESSFRRAMEEMSPFPDAAYGLGETLEKLDRNLDAIAAYQRCHDEVAAQADSPASARSLQRKAAHAIARLQRRFADLAKIDKDFIDRCMAFGRKYGDTNPAQARLAYEAVLGIDPAHASAKAALERLPSAPKREQPAPPSPAAPKPWGKSLIVSDDLEAWSPGLAKEWSCSAGVVTGDVPDRDGKLNWLDDREFEENYALRVRFRVVHVHDEDRRAFGVFFGGR